MVALLFLATELNTHCLISDNAGRALSQLAQANVPWVLERSSRKRRAPSKEPEDNFGALHLLNDFPWGPFTNA